MNSEPTVRELVEAVSHQQPNACDLIHEVARRDPGLPAVVDRQTGLTLGFGELSTRIAKTASRLQAIGLRPRDRVALFVADGPRFVKPQRGHEDGCVNGVCFEKRAGEFVSHDA